MAEHKMLFEEPVKQASFYEKLFGFVKTVIGQGIDFFKKCLSALGDGIDVLYQKVEYLSNALDAHTPTADFLSDVSAFQGVFIALAVPLSLEIISRVSERYKSDVISKLFARDAVIRYLPLILVINITFVLVAQFMIGKDAAIENYRVLLWLIFIFCLMSTVLLLIFLNVLKKYSTDSTYVFNKIVERAKKSLR